MYFFSYFENFRNFISKMDSGAENIGTNIFYFCFTMCRRFSSFVWLTVFLVELMLCRGHLLLVCGRNLPVSISVLNLFCTYKFHSESNNIILRLFLRRLFGIGVKLSINIMLSNTCLYILYNVLYNF